MFPPAGHLATLRRAGERIESDPLLPGRSTIEPPVADRI